MLASAAGGKSQKPFGYAILSLKPRTQRYRNDAHVPADRLTVANGLAVSVSEHDRAIDHDGPPQLRQEMSRVALGFERLP
jgi:hypothetical protein